MVSWLKELSLCLFLLMECDLSTILWPEAILHACYLRNRSPSLRSSTPFEAFFGEKPDVSHLRVFGCVAYALRDKRTELESKVDKGRFVGFSECINGYRVIFRMERLFTVGM
jgi:hypothetical protein